MEIKLAALSDMEQIMGIYRAALEYMKRNGNMTQWNDNYPSCDVVTNDISLQRLYVCREFGCDEIVAVFCFFIGEDPTYNKIFGGEWLNDNPYGVVHRIASSGKVRRIADVCIKWCEDRSPDMRIDTHKDNISMQNVLRRLGYVLCGEIFCRDGSPRLAFQKG